MRMKEIMENYPIDKTRIGFFDLDYMFSIETDKDVLIEENLFDCNGKDWIPFVRYNAGQFEVWGFVNWEINGYFSEGNEDDFVLMTYQIDFGWEKFDPDNLPSNTFIFVDPTPWDVAQVFDKRACEEGYIFTNNEELQNFIKRISED